MTGSINHTIPEDIAEAAESVLIAMGIASTPTNSAAIISALLAERQRSQWQPIETAPKDGRPILAADIGPYAYVAEWFKANRTWIGADGMYWEPTHWMPLPSAPQHPGNQEA